MAGFVSELLGRYAGGLGTGSHAEVVFKASDEKGQPSRGGQEFLVCRIPMWAMVTWWTLKALVWVLIVACRYWYVTVPAALLTWLYVEFGWWGLAGLFGSIVGTLGAWFLGHRASCLRFALFPAYGRYRRWALRRAWYPAMATAGLSVTFDKQTVLPVLKRVRYPGRGRGTDRADGHRADPGRLRQGQ